MIIVFLIVFLEFLKNLYFFYEILCVVYFIYKGSFLKYLGWYVIGYEEMVVILKDVRFKVWILFFEMLIKYQDFIYV